MSAELSPTNNVVVEKKLPFSFAKRHGVIIAEDGKTIIHKAKLTGPVLLELRRYLQGAFQLKSVNDEEFSSLLSQTYESTSNAAMQMIEEMKSDYDLNEIASSLSDTQDLLETENDAPIIKLLNALISEAIKQGASDIHIEPFEDNLVIRFRIDGVLHEVLQPKRALTPLIISRIKVMAKLDIAEKRLPQDGRIGLRIAGRNIDVRVSTLPGSYGERIVLRLLDKRTAKLDLRFLGMSPQVLGNMRKLINKPHGIILVTGPTGSGKSTSLYAALTELNDSKRNILTVEDPIEYYLPGIGQTQVNYKIDMTFARGLRAILRQDPDIVMVGEIRDLDTARIAVQASLTGHLVLSTLHTNTAIGAITRLEDMGVEPYLIASSMIGLVAQRLVRLLCPACKKAMPAQKDECELLGITDENPPMIYHPVGCAECKQVGYRGRTGIYELIMIDEKLRTMIHQNETEQKMEQFAHKTFPSIRRDGVRLVLDGMTALEEILRVSYEEASL